MTAFFLSNISAKYYKNPSRLSRVIAKNIGDVFLRHCVLLCQTTDYSLVVVETVLGILCRTLT